MSKYGEITNNGYVLYTCQHCRFANEYLLWYWYPYCKPTCSKGHPLNKDSCSCFDFELMGRLSR